MIVFLNTRRCVYTCTVSSKGM